LAIHKRGVGHFGQVDEPRPRIGQWVWAAAGPVWLIAAFTPFASFSAGPFPQ